MSNFNFNKKPVNNNGYGNQNQMQNQKQKRGVLSNLKPAQKMLLVVVAIFVIMVVAYSSYMAFSNKPTDKSTEVAEENISKELLTNKKFGGLELQDIEIETTSSLTHLMANITNTSEQQFPAGMVDVVFLDDAGKEMGRVPTYIDSVAPKGEIRIDTVIDKNYKTAHTFKVESQK